MTQEKIVQNTKKNPQKTQNKQTKNNPTNLKYQEYQIKQFTFPLGGKLIKGGKGCKHLSAYYVQAAVLS